MNSPTLILRTAAVLGGLAVVAGAFGAHALRARLPAEDLAIFETAVRYQMFHALALCACAWLAAEQRRARAAAACFALGSLVFSGTLYALVLTGPRWLGAITPVGGSLLVAGWVMLATVRLGPRRAPGGDRD
jgi:uncharacterized membrane protein YgdD (TMEM256/DUF423 family)